MILLLFAIGNLSAAELPAPTFSTVLHSLNQIFYAESRATREARELDLYRTLPPIADFYARLELPELALYYQQRAYAAALLVNGGRHENEVITRLGEQKTRYREQARAWFERREELTRQDSTRLVQLFWSGHNQVLRFSHDHDPVTLAPKVLAQFTDQFATLARPLEAATVATLFAAVTNPNYEPHLRRLAVETLGASPVPELAPMFAHYAVDRDSKGDLALASLEALTHFRNHLLIRPLTRVLENSGAPPAARRLAAEALGNYEDHTARAVLENIAWLELDGMWEVGLAALQSLEKNGTPETLARLKKRFGRGFDSLRKSDAVRASLLSLGRRLAIDCRDLLGKRT